VTCLAAPVPCTRSWVPKLITCALENTSWTFLSFLFVHRCLGCAALTKMVIQKPLFSTHQHSDHFSSFLHWAPRVHWVHLKYTIFYRGIWGIKWATMKMLFEYNLCMFPKKAAWPIFLKTAIMVSSSLLYVLRLSPHYVVEIKVLSKCNRWCKHK